MENSLLKNEFHCYQRFLYRSDQRFVYCSDQRFVYRCDQRFVYRSDQRLCKIIMYNKLTS